MGVYEKNEIITLKRSRRMFKKALRVYHKKNSKQAIDYYEVLVELEIPMGARIRRGKWDTLPNNKQRAEYAIVKAFEDLPEGSRRLGDSIHPSNLEYYRPTRKVVSNYNKTFEYNVGKTVCPGCPFNTDANITCAPGIHCFDTKEEAVNYIWN